MVGPGNYVIGIATPVSAVLPGSTAARIDAAALRESGKVCSCSAVARLREVGMKL
jgi:hypothetical protein